MKTKQAQKRNYQKELDRLISSLPEGDPPRLLLHSCCAPCSSYVLEYLSDHFLITDFFYNPNIWPEEEHVKRTEELQRLIQQMPQKYPITYVEGSYHPEDFYQRVRGLEQIPEGGERCFACYRFRMEEAAKLAAEGGFDYFTTTLTISPLKNAEKLNEIGRELEEIYGVKHLPSDFKKKNGYKRSTELSREYDLYRQDYCGCIYSYQERQKQKAAAAALSQEEHKEEH